MKLLIHIGCHKTGTKTFQSFCKRNKKALEKAGVTYPDLKIGKQHSFVAHSIQHKGIDDWINKLDWILQNHLNEFQAALISGEDFENCIVDIHLKKNIEQAALSRGFESVTWVVVYRHPFSYLQSIYSEMSKHSCILDFGNLCEVALRAGYVSIASPLYNYIFIIDFLRFSESFRESSKSNVLQYTMEKFLYTFPGKCLFDDVGLPVLEKYIEKRDKRSSALNVRLSRFETEKNYCLNFLFGRHHVFRHGVSRAIWAIPILPLILVRYLRVSRNIKRYRNRF